jgi:ketosteroid isomerase-like protein
MNRCTLFHLKFARGGAPRHTRLAIIAIAIVAIFTMAALHARAGRTDDEKTVASLDEQYQAAVKLNDAATMSRILADDFILVTGRGKTFTKADLVNDAKSGSSTYEHNEDSQRTVRVWGDTAVVTAFLWEKGTDHGQPFDHHAWFSDVYVRTPAGWRYVFGQSSIPLPQPSN